MVFVNVIKGNKKCIVFIIFVMVGILFWNFILLFVVIVYGVNILVVIFDIFVDLVFVLVGLI